jgi:hypothetical protein
MDENNCKIDPTNNCIIVVRMTKIVEILSYSCNIFKNLVANDYKSHVNGLVTFWLISISVFSLQKLAFPNTLLFPKFFFIISPWIRIQILTQLYVDILSLNDTLLFYMFNVDNTIYPF